METPKYKNALIVGAGQGLSASLARLFAREKIRVARRIDARKDRGAGSPGPGVRLRHSCASPNQVPVVACRLFDESVQLVAAEAAVPLLARPRGAAIVRLIFKGARCLSIGSQRSPGRAANVERA